MLAGEPASFAMRMDLRAVVPWSEWPMAPQASPVRVTLEHDGQSFVLQPGRTAPTAWRFDFHKHLASDSQPFDVAAARQVIGATNPVEAAPGSIRGDYALEVTYNLVHGSDSPESAEREIGLWFSDDELV